MYWYNTKQHRGHNGFELVTAYQIWYCQIVCNLICSWCITQFSCSDVQIVRLCVIWLSGCSYVIVRWCYSVCISHRLYNKDCAKREDLWKAVFVPMAAVMCDLQIVSLLCVSWSVLGVSHLICSWCITQCSCVTDLFCVQICVLQLQTVMRSVSPLVTILCLAHFLDQNVGDLGLFYNRDVLSVAHTSLLEASIGEPWQPMDGYTCGYQHPWDCDGVILSVFLIGYTTRTVPKGKTFGQQSLFRWLQLCVIRCRSVLLRSCSCLWSS